MRGPVLGTATLMMLATGCFAVGSGGGEQVSSGDGVISRQELEDSDADNAYEAVERLRPLWLRDRGATSVNRPGPTLPTVFVDGTRMGDISHLSTMDITDVERIHFLPPRRASVRYGMGYPRGVIEVISKKGN